MSIAITTGLAALMLFIQSTWLSHGFINGVSPDLALLVIAFSSFINKGGQGIISALLAGIIADLLSASPLGYNAFLYSIVGYLVSLAGFIAEIDSFFIPFLLGAGASLLIGLGSNLIAMIFGSSLIAFPVLSTEFLIELCMNALLSPLMFFVLSFCGNL